MGVARTFTQCEQIVSSPLPANRMEPPPETPVPESFDDWLYDPPELPADQFLPPWAWWVIAGFASILLLLAFFKFRKHLRIPPNPQPPWESALASLKSLRKRAETLPPSEMGTALVATVNRFLHRRYGELASFRTRDEIFDPSSRPDGSAPLPPGVSARFAPLMARCEEMRFAGKKSTSATRRQVVDATVEAMKDEAA